MNSSPKGFCCVPVVPTIIPCCMGPFDLNVTCSFGEVTIMNTNIACDPGKIIILRREGNNFVGPVVTMGTYTGPFVFVDDGSMFPMVPGEMYTYYLMNECGNLVSAEVPVIYCTDQCCTEPPAITLVDPPCVSAFGQYTSKICLVSGNCPWYKLYLKDEQEVFNYLYTFSGVGDCYDFIFGHCYTHVFKVVGGCDDPGIKFEKIYYFFTFPCCSLLTGWTVTELNGEVTVTITGGNGFLDCLTLKITIERSSDGVNWVTLVSGQLPTGTLKDYPTPLKTWYYRAFYDADDGFCNKKQKCVPFCFEEKSVYVNANCCPSLTVDVVELNGKFTVTVSGCEDYRVGSYWLYVKKSTDLAFTSGIHMGTNPMVVTYPTGFTYDFKVEVNQPYCPLTSFYKYGVVSPCYIAPSATSLVLTVRRSELPRVVAIGFDIYIPCCCAFNDVDDVFALITDLGGQLMVSSIVARRDTGCNGMKRISVSFNLARNNAVVGQTYNMKMLVWVCMETLAGLRTFEVPFQIKIV